jgi:hypothetical protein
MSEPDYKNRSGQSVMRRAHVAGTDRDQYLYVLRSRVCGHEYAASNPNIVQHKVLGCQVVLQGSDFGNCAGDFCGKKRRSASLLLHTHLARNP